ncbi:hypothetical protein VPNG_05380 [Cytospora leucostoma]|uniref:Uncharacterized protein n=1 Tax=Cytospora leucostoma TaxID=1230097 RepID=A0A423X4K6_9PEZI|nr:hypothetical protein VPNG_05380 [Cytospora leucostoma]
MLLFTILCTLLPMMMGAVSGRAVLSPRDPDVHMVMVNGQLRECYVHAGHELFCVGDDATATTTVTLVRQTTSTETHTKGPTPTRTIIVTASPVITTAKETSTTTLTTTSSVVVTA